MNFINKMKKLDLSPHLLFNKNKPTIAETLRIEPGLIYGLENLKKLHIKRLSIFTKKSTTTQKRYDHFCKVI